MKEAGRSNLPGPAAFRAIDGYGRQIPDRLERLRFVHMCARAARRYSRCVRTWPFCRWFYRLMLRESLSQPADNGEPWLRWSDRALLWTFRRRNLLARHWRTGFALACLLLWSASGFVKQRLHFPRSWQTSSWKKTEAIQVAQSAIAPDRREEEIWLVETKGETDLYSNGLQVMNDYLTHTGPRCYPAWLRGTGENLEVVEWLSEPRGLLLHTTESELTPLKKAHNDLIRSQGGSLLRYIQREKLYNFVIDRFGRVYRIVPEEEHAFHAGHSMWVDPKALYVNLNSSFVGVSFETPGVVSEATPSPERTVTPAQLASGRLLVAMLRYKFDMVATNVVTHEMVSLNPSSMLIGYHTDWRGRLPFQKLGLPDNYQRLIPSVAEWGFRYDSQFVRDLGGRLWEGVRHSQDRFRHAAALFNMPVEDYRLRKQRHFQRLLKRLRRLASAGRTGRDEDSTSGPVGPCEAMPAVPEKILH